MLAKVAETATIRSILLELLCSWAITSFILLTTASTVAPRVSSFSKCTSSIMNSRTCWTNDLLSRHLLVMLSHFSYKMNTYEKKPLFLCGRIFREVKNVFIGHIYWTYLLYLLKCLLDLFYCVVNYWNIFLAILNCYVIKWTKTGQSSKLTKNINIYDTYLELSFRGGDNIHVPQIIEDSQKYNILVIYYTVK